MGNYSSVDRSEIAKDWHARGFSCGLWIDHAGREWSYHTHETDELFMTMSGELELEMDGQSFHPAIGEEIRIPAGTPHTIRNIGGKTACWLYGQQREPIVVPPIPDTSQEQLFHSEEKRKRPVKNTAAVEASKGT